MKSPLLKKIFKIFFLCFDLFLISLAFFLAWVIRFYGDSNLWWIIAKANNINDGSIGLDPEKRIRIPIEIQPILDSV